MPKRMAAVPEKLPMKTKHDESLSYKELLNQAQQAFSSGQYGPAIAFYQRIENPHSQKIEEGQTNYWIGLSCTTSEYEHAEQKFQNLVDNFPSSPWIPKAKFYQAKISTAGL